MFIKAIKLVALCLIMTYTVSAQSSRAIVNTNLINTSERWESALIEIPLQNAAPFIAFSMKWTGEKTRPEVRFSEEGTVWSEWEVLQLEIHAEQRQGHWVSQLYYADEKSRFVQIRADENMGQIAAHFYNPGKTKANSTNSNPGISRDPQYCPCPQPAFQGRLDWCPDGTCPDDATPQFTTATHLIIHHSAGTNSANDWSAIVRSIWDFHTGVNGWDDIGYNWLVDPNGVIYEGRGDGRLGAHFCGTNGATVGTCVLGDFTNVTPTNAALDALKELYAWKACDISVDPLGTALHSGSGLVLDRISGHRDGCSTQCPGNSFYPLLPGVREDVVEYTALSCAAIGAPQNLTATAISETSISLDWADVTDNEEGFQIERATAFNGPYSELTIVGENITSFEDNGLTPQTGYYYRIRSFNVQDTSIYSNKAFAATVIVSTEEVADKSEFKVFPNPATDRVSISWETDIVGTIQMSLRDLTGKEILSQQSSGSQGRQELDVNHLPAGMYWLEIFTEQGKQQTYKLIKG